VEQEEFVAVVGPSGSGKSTFLHLAGGLDLPTSGEVMVGGQFTTSLSDLELTRLRRQHIGFVFQAFNLVPTLTAMENTALPALLRGGRYAEVRPKAEALLERVGLRHRVAHRPEELSGGELQRVAIARALINAPPLLLADEPTGNLDSVTGLAILNLLREVGSGRTLVIITHDPKVASVAQRLIQIKDGCLQ
jgi:putative ABC transport system ATP-binding protein